METSSQTARIDVPRFEIRYRSLHVQGRGYAFPCDAVGRVDLDQLSDRARENYFFARAMVGVGLMSTQVVLAP